MEFLNKWMGMKVALPPLSIGVPWVLFLIVLVLMVNADMWPSLLGEEQEYGNSKETSDDFAELSSSLNPLHRLQNISDGSLSTGFLHDLDVYHTHFARYRGKSLTLLQLGPQSGSLIEMWRSYFGPQVRIIGADGDPGCKALEKPTDKVYMYAGNQTSVDFWRALAVNVSSIDILIDRRFKPPEQPTFVLQELNCVLALDGVYVAESMQRVDWRFWKWFEKEEDRLRYASSLLHELQNVEVSSSCPSHSEDMTLVGAADSVHLYDGMLVIDKHTGSSTSGGPEGNGQPRMGNQTQLHDSLPASEEQEVGDNTLGNGGQKGGKNNTGSGQPSKQEGELNADAKVAPGNSTSGRKGSSWEEVGGASAHNQKQTMEGVADMPEEEGGKGAQEMARDAVPEESNQEKHIGDPTDAAGTGAIASNDTEAEKKLDRLAKAEGVKEKHR